MFKQLTSLFLLFMFSVQYIIVPEIFAQDIVNSELSQDTAPATENDAGIGSESIIDLTDVMQTAATSGILSDNLSSMISDSSSTSTNITPIETPILVSSEDLQFVYYQQLDLVDTLSSDKYKNFPSFFKVPSSEKASEYINFMVGKIRDIRELKNGKAIRVASRYNGENAVYELLIHNNYTSSEFLNPIINAEYLISYLPYIFKTGEKVTYLAAFWDLASVPELVYKDNQVANIGQDTAKYIEPYFVTKYLTESVVLSSDIVKNSGEGINPGTPTPKCPSHHR